MKLNLMKLKFMKINLLLAGLAAVVLSSCIGISADITIKADGSGTIALEYRVSQELESLGRLDGNESRPAVPAGKIDFERTAARIPGLKLTGFSSKEKRNGSGGTDLVTNVTLAFKDTGALLAFLDGTGSSTLVEESGVRRLRLSLFAPRDSVSNDLLALLRDVYGGYELSLSFSLPKNAALTMIPASVPAAKLVSGGKKVSFSIGMGELLSLNEGLVLEIRY